MFSVMGSVPQSGTVAAADALGLVEPDSAGAAVAGAARRCGCRDRPGCGAPGDHDGGEPEGRQCPMGGQPPGW